MFDNLLISLGQLCDDGCTIVHTKNDLIILNKYGICSKIGYGLCDIPFPQNKVTCKNQENPPTIQTNNLIK